MYKVQKIPTSRPIPLKKKISAFTKTTAKNLSKPVSSLFGYAKHEVKKQQHAAILESTWNDPSFLENGSTLQIPITADVKIRLTSTIRNEENSFISASIRMLEALILEKEIPASSDIDIPALKCMDTLDEIWIECLRASEDMVSNFNKFIKNARKEITKSFTYTSSAEDEENMFILQTGQCIKSGQKLSNVQFRQIFPSGKPTRENIHEHYAALGLRFTKKLLKNIELCTKVNENMLKTGSLNYVDGTFESIKEHALQSKAEVSKTEHESSCDVSFGDVINSWQDEGRSVLLALKGCFMLCNFLTFVTDYLKFSFGLLREKQDKIRLDDILLNES